MSMVDDWVAQVHADGARVITRMPATVSSVFAGQLATRAKVPDASLGDGPASWDYQLAPFFVRVEDNGGDLTDQIVIASNAIDTAYADTVLGFVDSAAVAAGSVIHEGVKVAGDGVAAALGISTWTLWAGLAGLAWVALRQPERTKSYVRRLVA